MTKIYVIHENNDWMPPLREAFNKLGLPFEEWYIDNHQFDLNDVPPEGIFYNRMSASSHTRGHRFAPEMTGSILSWLDSHNRTVINGRKALQLELRKSEQYLALQKWGIRHPKTLICNDIRHIVSAARKLNQFPFIIKPNRGGKGAGVQLFHSIESLESTIDSGNLGESLDGIWLIQQYVKPADGRIVRAEFVGGKFLYAVSIDASGGFQLCPADSCNIEDAHCPVGSKAESSKFKILQQHNNPDLKLYAHFLKENNIGVGALEYVEDIFGDRYVYDVNTNTNYNSAAENAVGNTKQGMLAIAEHLGSLLWEEQAEFQIGTRAMAH